MRRTLHGMAVLFLSTTITGCSVIGFTIGAMKDAQKKDKDGTTAVEALTIRPGSSIEITLEDGTTISGNYAGPASESGEAYEPAFKASREHLLSEHAIPKLGSLVTFRTTLQGGSTSSTMQARLFGMNRVGMFIETDRSAAMVPWSELLFVREPPHASISGEALAELTATGAIPSVKGISVEDGVARHVVAFADATEFHARPSRNAKWVGLGVGVVLDVGTMIRASNEGFLFE